MHVWVPAHDSDLGLGILFKEDPHDVGALVAASANDEIRGSVHRVELGVPSAGSQQLTGVEAVNWNSDLVSRLFGN